MAEPWDNDPIVATGAEPWANDPIEAPAASASTSTATEAFQRGLGKGVTFNFYDELAGIMRAGGVDPNDENIAHAIKGLAVGGYKKLTGDPEAERLYNEQVATTRAQSDQLEKEHPYASLGGNVAGALALPGLGAAKGATLAGRMGYGAAVGAGTGALYGLGEGEGSLTERTPTALTGAAIGGAAGGLIPPVTEGLYQAGKQITSPIRNLITGAITPETVASRRVAGALSRDEAAGIGGLTPSELTAAQTSGMPATVMDMGGDTTRALARSAANTSPEGRAALNQVIDQRFESQAPRTKSWLESTFNYPNAAAQQQALEQAGRTANNAAYKAAYKAGESGIWSPELERLAGSDAVSKAMQTAVKSSRDEAVLKGQGAFNPKISFTPDGRIQFNRGPTGVPTYPDLQYWDQVRRELSDSARRAGYGTEESKRLGGFAKSLNTELDKQVPEYANARQSAASFFGAQDALEAGKNFVGGGQRYKIPEVQSALAKMSPSERKLFQDGYVSRFVEKIDNTKDRGNMLNQIAQHEPARKEMELALGHQKAAEFEARLRVEGIMDKARGAVQGQSTTARQLTELGLAGGLGGIGLYHESPGEMGTAALAAVFLHGKNKVNAKLAKHVAQMLASSDPIVIQRGLKHVARSQKMTDALRAAGPRLAAVAGEQAGSR